MKRLLAFVLCLMLLAGTACAERLPDEQLVTYYNKSVFVGDSLVRMLRNYIVNTEQKAHPDYFKDTRFFAEYSYQLYAASRETPSSSKVDLKYKGSDITLCKLMEKLQPEKLFILAGLNDKIGEKTEKGMEYIDKIMALMAEYAPDTQVYFFSLTPVTAKVEKKRPNLQSKWDAYNVELEKKCEEVGAIYIDIATDLKGENGLMKKGISHDGEYHLNDKGNAIWVQTLLDFAQSQYDANKWVPVDEEY
ncbi:MAG: hypothetical protein E7316_10400 [Clostridiales bacterium]|nr:hypothetical protein [Clostridiales bacterium]